MTSTNRGNYWLVDHSRYSPETDLRTKVIPQGDSVMEVLNESRVAIQSDHVHMTKFDNSTNEIYRLLVRKIRELLKPQAVELAAADEGGTSQPHDEPILKPPGLIYDDEQHTLDPESM